YGIFFFDQNHGWIVGSQNTIITTTNNGGLWTVGAAANPPAGAQIVWRSVHVDTYGTNGGSGDGWAVGYDNVTGNEATAWWNGAGWSYLPLPDLVAPGLGLYSVFTTNPTDGWAVGAQPETGNNTLTGIFHLDPAIPPTVGQQATASNTTTESTSSSSSGTSQVTTSSSSSASTEPVTATSSLTVTSVTTSVSTLTIMSTPTSSTSTYSTPMTLPAVPGFPWESIIAGLILGMIALSIIRRRRK
ncbi:MAG TPA: hypothetical protein VLV18_01625, partial [Terriglobales bacterium]|nr:hypothetical protein [Terriglobales bacterium]